MKIVTVRLWSAASFAGFLVLMGAVAARAESKECQALELGIAAFNHPPSVSRPNPNQKDEEFQDFETIDQKMAKNPDDLLLEGLRNMKTDSKDPAVEQAQAERDSLNRKWMKASDLCQKARDRRTDQINKLDADLYRAKNYSELPTTGKSVAELQAKIDEMESAELPECVDSYASAVKADDAAAKHRAAEAVELQKAKSAWEAYDKAMENLKNAQEAKKNALKGAQEIFMREQALIQQSRDNLAGRSQDESYKKIVADTRAHALNTYNQLKGNLANFNCWAEVRNFITEQLDPRLERLQAPENAAPKEALVPDNAGPEEEAVPKTVASAKVIVPDLSGFKNVAEMQQALKRAGLSGMFMTTPPHFPEEALKFVGQSPAAGQEAASGSVVTVSTYEKYQAAPLDASSQHLFGYWEGTATKVVDEVNSDYIDKQQKWYVYIALRDGEIMTNLNWPSHLHGETFIRPAGASYPSSEGTQKIEGGRIVCELVTKSNPDSKGNVKVASRTYVAVQAIGNKMTGFIETYAGDSPSPRFKSRIEAVNMGYPPKDMPPIEN